MIDITIPEVDTTITKKKNTKESNIHGFLEADIHRITRENGGIFMFYNEAGELLFVGKARKLRQRIKRHFEDSVSVMKKHRDEIARIDVCLVKSSVDREIYETYIINKYKAKYNVDKVFYK